MLLSVTCWAHRKRALGGREDANHLHGGGVAIAGHAIIAAGQADIIVHVDGRLWLRLLLDPV
jgi:hypothetical protein